MEGAPSPRIRFFTGARGQRIAYAIAGSGPPLVLPAWWVSHVERDWADPRFRAFFEPLARRHTVVRYDRPGVGLSVRERSDFSMRSEVAVLEALVDHLGFERISLLGFSCGGPPAVHYAGHHPERVERLVLVNSYAFGGELTTPETQRALVDLVRAHWGLGAQTISDLFAPDLDRKSARRMARVQQEWSSAELASRLLALSFAMECREAASALSLPTLVIHRRKDLTVRLDAGRALAALVPDADFLPVDGNAHVPWQGESGPILDAVLAFLGAPAPQRDPRVTADPDDCLWRREGELWHVRFEGRAAHLPHRKGLEDLAVLLEHPMREIPARELAAGVGSAGSLEPDAGADPVLDETARRAYAERAGAIESELADAEARNDLGRVEALRAEREALLAELGAARGLGGRARRLGDARERARKAVSARIRESIKRLREVHPALAAHLEASVTTGLSCCYRPSPARTWLT